MSYRSSRTGNAGPQQSHVYDQSYGGAPQQQGAYIYGQQQPGAYPQAAEYPQAVTVTSILPPNSYLAWSIISLFFFSLLLGIAALVFSLDVRADYAKRLHAEALYMSSVAKVLNIIATVLFVVNLFTPITLVSINSYKVFIR